MLNLSPLIFFALFSLTYLPSRAQEKSAKIEVRTIDVAGVHRLIAERHGKILVLNIWATWCQPCVEEFPDIEKLRQAIADSAADVVAISVDYPDEINSKILPFLRSHSVTFPVYVCDVKKEDEFISSLNPSWSGGVPATFIFDKYGQQRVFLFGQKSFDVFKSETDSVLTVQ